MFPDTGLLAANNLLYGTTYLGGSGRCGFDTCGTIYEVTTTGRERVLHSFQGKPDGQLPEGSLVQLNKTLYGTTATGGDYAGTGEETGGTVFSLTP